jgi:hypothetical protein
LDCRYELAVKHSPKLVNIPLVRPGHHQKQKKRTDNFAAKQSQMNFDEEDGLGDGIGAL